ncbi:MAG: thioredoxin [Bacteroidetes bacterium]|nr:thioredoxin [Bacteroidota bacterium]
MDYTLLLWLVVLVLLGVLFYRRVRQFRALTSHSADESDAPVQVLNGSNFDQTIANGLTLVDFWAPWCGPCRVIAPIMGSLASDYQGRVTVGKVNVDENQAIAARFGIRSIPTIILFKDGKVVEQLVGVRPKPALEKLLQKHLAQ